MGKEGAGRGALGKLSARLRLPAIPPRSVYVGPRRRGRRGVKVQRPQCRTPEKVPVPPALQIGARIGPRPAKARPPRSCFTSVDAMVTQEGGGRAKNTHRFDEASLSMGLAPTPAISPKSFRRTRPLRLAANPEVERCSQRVYKVSLAELPRGRRGGAKKKSFFLLIVDPADFTGARAASARTRAPRPPPCGRAHTLTLPPLRALARLSQVGPGEARARRRAATLTR